ncbi:MAG: hypothetical protein Q4A01_04930 [Coriobacteriales bacterium]|nr:hypothetical protein [Coriobacteriales bacterium]
MLIATGKAKASRTGGQRNQLVELCRFVAALVILVHHSYLLGARGSCKCGWVFVEFFFVLTGYFTTRHVVKAASADNSPKEALCYTRDKIVCMVPFAWTGILLGIVATLMGPVPFEHGMRKLLSLPFNFLFLMGSPLASHSVNFDTPLWYLTMIVLFLPPLIVVMRKAPHAYQYLLCWLVPILLLSYTMQTEGKLAVWEITIPLLIRGLADLMLGSLVFYLAEYARRVLSERGMLLVRVLAIGSFAAFCAFVVLLPYDGTVFSAELVLATVVVALLVLTNERNYVCARPVYALALHLGALSMPIFCLHYPMQRIVQICLPTMGYGGKLVVSLVATIVLSEILLWGVGMARKRRA